MADGTIVVTNDDGIDSPGLARLVERLEPIGDVVVVAPATNQSAVGRAIDAAASVEAHPRGYAVAGSPATCVVAAVTALDVDPDVVVSGINKGANLGAAVLARSGTVGAAMEAAYLDLPAIAVSTYIPFERIQGDFNEYSPEPSAYDPAAAVAGHLTGTLLDIGLPDGVDYLNVNAPLVADLRSTTVEVTEPAGGYHTVADRDGAHLTLYDRQFELLHAGTLDVEEATDRAAIAAGRTSVSPLALPQRVPSASIRTAFERRYLDGISTQLDGLES